ncbi:carbohydrate esterase family 1 protein [Penicillium herquei]|nr:carbohydrate esterase family 1 protein [Penicillium herquei]
MALFYISLLLLLRATLIVAASLTCQDMRLDPQITKGSTINVSITSDGLDRSYLLSFPSDYHPQVAAPAIFSFHGGTRTAESQLELDQLTNPEFNTQALVVYPQGIDNTWQGVPGVTTNDIKFTSDILDDISSRCLVDLDRVYATGKSDGGGLCNLLACDAAMSLRIAAFAPVSGAYYVDTLPCVASTVVNPCQAGRSDIPFLAFHGGNDTVISFWGGERKNACLPTIPHFIREWAERDMLSVRNKTSSVSSNTSWYSYGPRGLVGLIFDAVIGHDWPSTVPNADNQVAGHHVASFNATPIILDFFNRYTLA